MEESFSWKIIYFAAIFSLIVLGIAYYFISPRESTFFSEVKTEKIAEFKQTRVEGRKEGKPLWELRAVSGWTDKNQEITHLENVSGGNIYNSAGKIAVSDLCAPRAQVFRRSEIVEAFGPLKADFDLGKFSSRPGEKNKWIKMTGNHIRYIPSDKRSELDTDLILSKKDSVVHAEKINVDHEKKIANITEKIRIIRKDGVIKADSIEYLGEAEQLNAAGNVNLALKEGRIKTFVKCNKGILFLDAYRDISLSGSIEAAQGKKRSSAQDGTYSRKKNGLFLRGKTRTILEKGEKKELKEKTIVLAEEIFFSTRNGDARATGSVEVTQKSREARSDTAVYDEKRDILTLSGNVYMKEKERWISCKKIIISVKKETFEASGVSGARFKL